MSRINFKLSNYYHVSGKWDCVLSDRNQMSELWNLSLVQLSALEIFGELNIIAFVLMNNHFHLLIKLKTSEVISELNLYFKKNMTQNLMNVGVLDNSSEFHDLFFKRISSFAELKELYRYVYRNPIEANICDKAEDYAYSTLHYALKKNFNLAKEDPFHLIFNEPRVLQWINSKDKPLYYTYEVICHDL